MKYEDEENDFFMKEDKILNNSYNTGDINYEAFTHVLKVDDRITHLYKDELSDNLVEQRTIKLLDERIFYYFELSPFYEKYKTPKKVDKNDLVKMYYYFKDKLIRENSFTIAQIFMAFAEFFQVNYDLLYSEISVLDKEGLLRELNDKYALNRKIKSKKLF